MSIQITEAELIEALHASQIGEGDDAARTTEELCATTGRSIRHVRTALKELARQGRLRTHRVRRVALDGRNALVAAYTILPAAPARAA